MSNLLLFPLREEGELICISQSISWLIGALKIQRCPERIILSGRKLIMNKLPLRTRGTHLFPRALISTLKIYLLNARSKISYLLSSIIGLFQNVNDGQESGLISNKAPPSSNLNPTE